MKKPIKKTVIIAFEGMSGAGKTTTIRMLAENVVKGAGIVSQIELPTLRQDGLITSKRYLDAEIEKAETIRLMCKTCKFILVDRTFLTTLAYSYARSKIVNDQGSHRKLVRYFRCLDAKYQFPRPTYLFFLLTRIDCSIRRRSRYTNQNPSSRWFNHRFLKHFEAFYCQRRIGFNMPRPFIIDTTAMTSKEVASAISEYL